MDHCEVCSAADLKSHYRCGLCRAWVCLSCFLKANRLCRPCAAANTKADPYAEQRTDFEDDVMSSLLDIQ